jgi:hypothetical protein
MRKLQLANLNSNSQFCVMEQEQQKNIRGGDQFADGKLSKDEQAFIAIVFKAVSSKPGAFVPKLDDPGFNQEIQQKYPDIYNALSPS